MIMPYLLYMTKKYARAMLTLRGGMQWIHYGTPAVDDASRGARHGVPVEHASASATTGSTSRPGVQLEQGPRLCQWLHSDVAFNRQSVVTRPLSIFFFFFLSKAVYYFHAPPPIMVSRDI